MTIDLNKFFGTDGVRGRAGVDLTADLAFRLGRASAGHHMERGARRVILARDTRISGDAIASAFMAGAASVGVDVVDLGIAPTPAVSVILSRAPSTDPSFGVVISASHNPYQDNGIKLFSPSGLKIARGEEEAIERRVRMVSEHDASDADIGRVLPDPALVGGYIDSIRKRFPVRLNQTRLVVDAAHGAVAPHVRRLFDGGAADLVLLNERFSGTDINDRCGSTHVESLDSHLNSSAVGLAFDGDGDRCLIRIPGSKSKNPNADFQTVDGDGMLLMFARHMVREGPVVGTVMSNGALAAELEKMNRPFVRAPVGDREVYDAMVSEKSNLGGEQSGHLIFREFQRTGDGAATALAFLTVLANAYGESIEKLCADLPERFPQKLVNVRVAEKRPYEDDPILADAVRSASETLGKHGRLVIRYSGTEPLLRIMAEAPSSSDVEEQVAALESLFRQRLA